MVVKSGSSTSFVFPFVMHPGMGGPHHFEVHVRTNDPNNAELIFHVYANAVEAKQS